MPSGSVDAAARRRARSENYVGGIDDEGARPEATASAVLVTDGRLVLIGSSSTHRRDGRTAGA
jgi:hypothetical protein